jgi:ankyrin repeat protein
MRLLQAVGFVVALATSAASLLAQAAEQDLSVNARLLLAARNGDAAGVDRALKAGASPNARNRLGETVLVIALKKNDLTMATTMIDAGADVNRAAVNGVTPLMAAAFGGHTATATTLLAKGADFKPVDRLQKNAMIYAAGAGSTEIVQMLIAKCADPNAVYANDLTALMWAAGFGKTATVKALLDVGARADLRDNRGKTASDMAREGKFDETGAARNPHLVSLIPGAPRSAGAAHVAHATKPFRAGRHDRRLRLSAPATCRTAPAISQLVARCTAERKSLSATFLPAHPGSVRPKNLTG